MQQFFILGYFQDVHRPDHAVTVVHVGEQPHLPTLIGYGE